MPSDQSTDRVVAEIAEKLKDKAQREQSVHKEVHPQAHGSIGISVAEASQLFLQSLLCGISSRLHLLDKRNIG